MDLSEDELELKKQEFFDKNLENSPFCTDECQDPCDIPYHIKMPSRKELEENTSELNHPNAKVNVVEVPVDAKEHTK